MTKRREKSVPFLCTGHYYRSRFAEVLFNSVADRMGCPGRCRPGGWSWSGASATSARMRVMGDMTI
jgi:hypothetical protein